MAYIILVEDDVGQREELHSFLMHAGHQVKSVGDGMQLDLCLSTFTPEIVLLDYGLPVESGKKLIARLRESYGYAVGLVMVTARSMANDRVACRRAGADDYLVKPIDFGELLALIDNLSERLSLNISTETPWRLMRTRSELAPPDAAPIPLTGWELLLLEALANARNRQVDRDTLIRAVGRNPLAYDPRALEANISRLRRKLPVLDNGRNPLQAMRGMGYQFLRPLVIVS